MGGEGVYRAKLNPSKFGRNARARVCARGVVTGQRVAVCSTPKKPFMYVNSLPPPCVVSAVLGAISAVGFSSKGKNHYVIGITWTTDASEEATRGDGGENNVHEPSS